MHGSVEQRIDLLHGLMDTDGSGKKNRITYSTLSYGMARDIALLVRSLGGQAIIRRYDRRNEGKSVEFQVNVRIKVWSVLSRTESCRVGYKKNKLLFTVYLIHRICQGGRFRMYKRDRSGSFVPDKQLYRNAQYAGEYRYHQQS